LEVTLELGNLASWFSAIATISAAIISLYIASNKNKPIIKIKPDLKGGVLKDLSNKDSQILNLITFKVDNKSIVPVEVWQCGFIEVKGIKKVLPKFIIKKFPFIVLKSESQIPKQFQYPCKVEAYDTNIIAFDYSIRKELAKKLYKDTGQSDFYGYAYIADNFGNIHLADKLSEIKELEKVVK